VSSAKNTHYRHKHECNTSAYTLIFSVLPCTLHKQGMILLHIIWCCLQIHKQYSTTNKTTRPNWAHNGERE